jgi:hypothetical protein
MTAKQTATLKQVSTVATSAGYKLTQRTDMGRSVVRMYRKGGNAFAAFVDVNGRLTFKGRDKAGRASGAGFVDFRAHLAN